MGSRSRVCLRGWWPHFETATRGTSRADVWCSTERRARRGCTPGFGPGFFQPDGISCCRAALRLRPSGFTPQKSNPRRRKFAGTRTTRSSGCARSRPFAYGGTLPLGVVVGEAGTTIGSSDGILIQWAEADCLHYEWLTDSAGPVRRLSFFGGTGPPRFGSGITILCTRTRGDFLVVVPVFTMEGPAEESMVNRASGFGPGTICFLSQDNHFSASSRSGPSREKTVRVSFPHGFDLRRLNDDDVRLIFPHGGGGDLPRPRRQAGGGGYPPMRSWVSS